MATITDRYLDTDSAGGDGSTAGLSGASAAYNDMNAAIADIKADFPSFVTSDVHVRLHCAATSGVVDSLSATATTFNSTTDATRYLEIIFESGYRISQSNSFWNCLSMDTVKFVLRNVDILHTGSDANGAKGILIVGKAGGWHEIDGGTIRSTAAGTSSTHAAIWCSGVVDCVLIQRNLVVKGWGRGTAPNNGFSAGRIAVIDNCTVVDCASGITVVRASGDTWLIRNNVGQGNTTDFDVSGSGGTYTHSGNISEDTTSPDAAGQSTVVAFVDEVNDDFHLAVAGSAADESGTDLSSDTYAFTTDRDGITRSVPWSSGAYEAVASVQLVRPTADIADGNWTNELGTNTDLFASLDETSPSDADYIQSPVNPVDEAVDIQLGTSSTPLAGDHVLRYRIRDV